ncbi:sigma-70 family RNA polymerase sigma factor [Paracoccus sp. M683]|uniref:sigma-70 family RNA polymerase sigma factor n=1 Tax=Paracoccus sp. M683 TaxID=2594268 RepID=UPI00117D2060|nr:sigma-70 family RNA polymerase sigma factor [Paracoccus sp. M683]TRW99594.1 sigma-70 family RNA polymerase sigma factor [Paracoccus sp. M683]
MRNEDDPWAGLLCAALAGDEAAYARFLTAVTPVMRGIVRAKGAGIDPSDREDIVQNILLAIHLKRGTWRQDRPLRPWLYAIARHKIVDAYRVRGRRMNLPIEDFQDLLPQPEQPDPTERDDAMKTIARLDPRSADILRGAALAGETTAETGRRLNMTEGAVRVALHRALQRLAALRDGENA